MRSAGFSVLGEEEILLFCYNSDFIVQYRFYSRLDDNLIPRQIRSSYNTIIQIDYLHSRICSLKFVEIQISLDIGNLKIDYFYSNLLHISL